MAFPSHMTEALRLTRAGRLTEAAALLRGVLPATAASPRPDAAPSRQPDPAPDAAGGRFERRHHAGPAGSMEYRLYRPAAVAPGMPLVVMLHGCTQSPEDFAAGTRMNRLAEAQGVLVAYPCQTQRGNMQKCWNWFRPGDQQRDRGEPALIAGMVRDIVAAERVDPARIYVAGLSAGGAAAAILGHAYPDLFAAIGIHSGLAAGAARNLPGALAAMKHGAPHGGAPGRFVPVITFHGAGDGTVNPANAEEIVRAAAAAAGTPLTVTARQGRAAGRDYSRKVSRDAGGRVLIEQWTIAGGGHAWSGGDPAGTHTDVAGPDASREMLGFFLDRQVR